MIFLLFLLVFSQHVFTSKLVQNELVQTSEENLFFSPIKNYINYVSEFPVREEIKNTTNLWKRAKNRPISYGLNILMNNNFGKKRAVKIFLPPLIWSAYNLKNIFYAPVNIALHTLDNLSSDTRKKKIGYVFAKRTKTILAHSLLWPIGLNLYTIGKISKLFDKDSLALASFCFATNSVFSSIYYVWHTFLIYNIPPLWKQMQKVPSTNIITFYIGILKINLPRITQ